MIAPLGQSVATHRGTFGAGGWLWYLAGILLASGVLGAFKAIEAIAAGGSPGDGLGTAAIAFVIGLVLLVVPVLRWRQHVEVFQHGFVAHRLHGTRAVSRDQVANAELITHRSRMSSFDEVRVSLRDGSSLSLRGLENAAQLRNLIAGSGAVAPVVSGAGAAWTPPTSGGWKPPGT